MSYILHICRACVVCVLNIELSTNFLIENIFSFLLTKSFLSLPILWPKCLLEAVNRWMLPYIIRKGKRLPFMANIRIRCSFQL